MVILCVSKVSSKPVIVSLAYSLIYNTTTTKGLLPESGGRLQDLVGTPETPSRAGDSSGAGHTSIVSHRVSCLTPQRVSPKASEKAFQD